MKWVIIFRSVTHLQLYAYSLLKDEEGEQTQLHALECECEWEWEQPAENWSTLTQPAEKSSLVCFIETCLLRQKCMDE